MTASTDEALRKIVEELHALVARARVKAQNDRPGTSGLYYWTGYGDALEHAAMLIEHGHMQLHLPMT